MYPAQPYMPPQSMTVKGVPMLYLPVMYYLAEELWHRTQTRGVLMSIGSITNGLLLTTDVGDRLLP